MCKLFQILLTVVIVLSISCTTYIFGSNISIIQQKEIVDIQVTVASIVFGIMGVWLAVVFPVTLRTVFDKKESNKNKLKALNEFRFLTIPMIASAFIIIYSLILYLVHPILIQASFLESYVAHTRSVSFFVISVLVVIQIWTILYIFAPGEKLRIRAQQNFNKRSRKERLNSESQTKV